MLWKGKVILLHKIFRQVDFIHSILTCLDAQTPGWCMHISLARIICSQHSGQGILAGKLCLCVSFWFLFAGNNKLMSGHIIYIPLESSVVMGGPSPLKLTYFTFHESYGRLLHTAWFSHVWIDIWMIHLSPAFLLRSLFDILLCLPFWWYCQNGGRDKETSSMLFLRTVSWKWCPKSSVLHYYY